MAKKIVECVKCKKITERKDAVREMTGEFFCKDCYTGKNKK